MGARQHRVAYDNSDGRLRGRALQAARLRIWANDPYCAMCGKLTTLQYPHQDAFELDHKSKISAGVDNSDDNLQVLCVSFIGGTKTGCHVEKTNKDEGRKERAKFDEGGRVVW